MLSKYFNKLSIKRFISTNLSFIYNVRLRHRSGLTLLFPSSSGSLSFSCVPTRVRAATDMREVVHGAPSMGWMDSLLNDDGTKWYALASITAGHRASCGKKKTPDRFAFRREKGRKLNQKMIRILVIFMWEWWWYAYFHVNQRYECW